MYASLPKFSSTACPAARKRKLCPLLENLEDRVLLYSTYGGHWVYGSRITYSFAPDGTSFGLGGPSSMLFNTLNAKFTQANWQLQFQKAAAVWQDVANINLVQVSDNGSMEGVSGNQQGDPRFGDIRIFMVPLGSGVLGETFLPPPYNGGTDAGDMFLNSTVNWQIGSSGYDLETVAIHEFGHALGLGESTIASACMYALYSGVKRSLTTDDINAIQSIWGKPQSDQYNGTLANPYPITSAIPSDSAITAYNNATANSVANNGNPNSVTSPYPRLTSGSPQEWFTVTVPQGMSGSTMYVAAQSTNLSMLSPDLLVTTPDFTSVYEEQYTAAYGATVRVSVPGVQAGDTYLIGVSGYAYGNPPIGDLTGAFGLQVNFGSPPKSPTPISPPNTVVLQQPDQGGGVDYAYSRNITIGHHSGPGYVYRLNTNQGNGSITPPPSNGAAGGSAETTTLGTAALVPTASAQPALLVSGNAEVSSSTSSQAIPDPGSTPWALQALDDVLLTWEKYPLSLFTKGNKTGFLLN